MNKQDKIAILNLERMSKGYSSFNVVEQSASANELKLELMDQMLQSNNTINYSLLVCQHPCELS